MLDTIDIRGQRDRPAIDPVLADPTGGRARVLALAGRVVAIVCTLWLAGVLLAGLGLLPAGDLPLGPALVAARPPAQRAFPVPTRPSPSDLAAAVTSRVGRAAVAAHRPVVAHGPVVGTAGAAAPRTGTAAPVARVPVPPSATGRHGAGSAPGQGAGAASGGSSGGGAGSGPSSSSGSTAGTGSSGASGSSGVSGTHGTHGTRSAGAPGQSVKTAAPGRVTSAPGRSKSTPGRTTVTAASTGTSTMTTIPGQSAASPGHTVTHGNGHAGG